MATKEELLEKAKELDVSGRSSMSKEELQKAVDEAEGGSSTGADSEASDPKNEEVQEALSPEGKEALDEMGEDSEAAKEADLALDASGPLHLEKPSERIATGAVSEEHAKELEEKFAGTPDDFVGDHSEAGPKADLEAAKADESADLEYAPPLQGEGGTIEAAPSGTFSASPIGASHAGARSRLFEQKGNFYTDGLSGSADHNLERAYELPERLQSNDAATRTAGDESLSEAAKEDKSGAEKADAEEAKSGDREE